MKSSGAKLEMSDRLIEFTPPLRCCGDQDLETQIWKLLKKSSYQPFSRMHPLF